MTCRLSSDRHRFGTQSGSSWRTTTPSAIIRAWKTDFRSPHPSLPYPIILFNADSASAECSATTIGPQPDACRFFFLDNSGSISHQPTGRGAGRDSLTNPPRPRPGLLSHVDDANLREFLQTLLTHFRPEP